MTKSDALDVRRTPRSRLEPRADQVSRSAHHTTFASMLFAQASPSKQIRFFPLLVWLTTLQHVVYCRYSRGRSCGAWDASAEKGDAAGDCRRDPVRRQLQGVLPAGRYHFCRRRTHHLGPLVCLVLDLKEGVSLIFTQLSCVCNHKSNKKIIIAESHVIAHCRSCLMLP